jgi:hypothetical protein
MVDVQVSEENALDTAWDSRDYVGGAFSYLHLIQRHDLTNQPRNTVPAGICQQLPRHARINQESAEVWVPHDVDEYVDRLRMVGQMRRLRSRALQIQQA